MKYFSKLILFVFIFSSVTGYSQMDEVALTTEQLVLKDTVYPSSTNDGTRKGEKEKKKADKIYDDLGYMSSVNIYNRLSSKDKKRIEVLAKMANSFRLNHETEDAEYWYSRFIHQTNEPEHLLHYAQVLQSNGNCEEAVRWFNKYKGFAKAEDIRHRDFIEDCQDLNDFISHDNIQLYNVESLNSDHLDFIPIPYDDGVVFTSTRGTDGFAINLDHWTNDNFSDLFYATQKEDGTFTKPEPLLGDINARFHDGVATFNRAQTIMIFTRNNYGGKSKKGLIDLKIYMATKGDDGYWAEAEPLPFNSNEFTTCHPTLSEDGRELYFASNRPGGYGGLDIYKSEFIGGMWQEPVNLGETVNSAGNELFPFIADDDVLYYASNGHKGLGGLDIYRAEQAEVVLPNSLDKSLVWNKRQNLGKPFNSKRDDFGFYINKKKTMGYLTSSRKGGLEVMIFILGNQAKAGMLKEILLIEKSVSMKMEHPIELKKQK